MPYSSDNDLLKEMSQSELAIICGDASGSTIDTDRTSYARSNADAFIDAYLYGRYELPMQQPVDPVIKKLSVDLTMANLFDYYYCSGSVPSTMVWRKINAVKLLKDLRAGYVSIQGAMHCVNAPPSIVRKGGPIVRQFDNDSLKRFD